jgi:thymidylate kinase
LNRWKREIWRRVGVRILRRAGKLPIYRRAPATGGLIVALLGADGSGKSTQANSLFKWLGWKIDVARIYFGSGDGPMSWHRAALLWLQRLLGRSGRREEKSNLAETPSHEPTHRPASQNSLRRLFKGLYAISLAYEKRSTLRKATRARNRGMIVICDRYPQNQIAGYNDGPLLTEWRDERAPWGLFAGLEQRLLSVFSSVSPDLVIKLNVSEEVSALRKADTPKEMIAKKIEAVRSLRFGPECQVIELDADRPLEDITMAVRSSVWQLL